MPEEGVCVRACVHLSSLLSASPCSNLQLWLVPSLFICFFKTPQPHQQGPWDWHRLIPPCYLCAWCCTKNRTFKFYHNITCRMIKRITKVTKSNKIWSTILPLPQHIKEIYCWGLYKSSCTPILTGMSALFFWHNSRSPCFSRVCCFSPCLGMLHALWYSLHPTNLCFCSWKSVTFLLCTAFSQLSLFVVAEWFTQRSYNSGKQANIFKFRESFCLHCAAAESRSRELFAARKQS